MKRKYIVTAVVVIVIAVSVGLLSRRDPTAPVPTPSTTPFRVGNFVVRNLALPAAERDSEKVAVTTDGTYVWVAEEDGTLFEMRAATGKLLRTLYNVAGEGPSISASDGVLWVAGNGPPHGKANTGFVTEIDSATGKVVQAISAPRYKLFFPLAIAANGTSVWVANTPSHPKTDVLTQINAHSGVLVRTTLTSRYGIDFALDLLADPSGVWVAGYGRTELASVTGATGVSAWSISNTTLSGDDRPLAAATGATSLWTANGGTSVLGINTTTGAVEQDLSNPPYPFADPSSLAVTAHGVWVINHLTGTLTLLNSATGALETTITGKQLRIINTELLGNSLLTAVGSNIWVFGPYGAMEISP